MSYNLFIQSGVIQLFFFFLKVNIGPTEIVSAAKMQ